MTGLRALARFTRPASAVEDRCELCGGALADRHGHVVDLEQRAFLCACRPCALLFDRPGAGAMRYRTVPDRVLVDPAFTLTDELWAAAGAPVRLAFVFHSSAVGRWTAVYPSPAGPMEAEVSADGWQALADATPLVGALEPDVEALAVYGRRGERVLACFLAPIDRCWSLVGRVRATWRGFDGGDAVRGEIDAFFADLRQRARPVRRPSA